MLLQQLLWGSSPAQIGAEGWTRSSLRAAVTSSPQRHPDWGETWDGTVRTHPGFMWKEPRARPRAWNTGVLSKEMCAGGKHELLQASRPAEFLQPRGHTQCLNSHSKVLDSENLPGLYLLFFSLTIFTSLSLLRVMNPSPVQVYSALQNKHKLRWKCPPASSPSPSPTGLFGCNEVYRPFATASWWFDCIKPITCHQSGGWKSAFDFGFDFFVCFIA